MVTLLVVGGAICNMPFSLEVVFQHANTNYPLEILLKWKAPTFLKNLSPTLWHVVIPICLG